MGEVNDREPRQPEVQPAPRAMCCYCGSVRNVSDLEYVTIWRNRRQETGLYCRDARCGVKAQMGAEG